MKTMITMTHSLNSCWSLTANNYISTSSRQNVIIWHLLYFTFVLILTFNSFDNIYCKISTWWRLDALSWRLEHIGTYSDVCVQAKEYLRNCEYGHFAQHQSCLRRQISTVYSESHGLHHRMILKKHTIRWTFLYIQTLKICKRFQK